MKQSKEGKALRAVAEYFATYGGAALYGICGALLGGHAGNRAKLFDGFNHGGSWAAFDAFKAEMLDLFRPDETNDGVGRFSDYFWPTNSAEGAEQRVWAALLLAEIADERAEQRATKAAAWREVARQFAEFKPARTRNGKYKGVVPHAGLCYVAAALPEFPLGKYHDVYHAGEAYDAVHLFQPDETNEGAGGRAHFWPIGTKQGAEQRVWAACFLAAMAETGDI